MWGGHYYAPRADVIVRKVNIIIIIIIIIYKWAMEQNLL